MEAKFEDLAKAERRLPRIEAELQTAEVRFPLPKPNHKANQFLFVSPNSDLLPKKSNVTKKNIRSLGTLTISMLSGMNSRRRCGRIRISLTTSEWVLFDRLKYCF